MTLDKTIKRFNDNAEYERTHGNLQGCLEFRQLVEWLKDYKRILSKQKVGKWLLFDDESNSYCCSACNTAYTLIDGTPKDNGYKYCPSCGAKMEEGE